MAASISQTRYDYKITLQEAIEQGKIVPVAFEKCPLCFNNRGELYCDTCTNSGHFTHTQRRDGPRFIEKRNEWLQKKKRRVDEIRRFELEIDDIERANSKRTEIETIKRKISLLKKALVETKAKCETEKVILAKDKKRRRSSQARLDHNQAVTMPNLKMKIANLTEAPTQNLPTLQDLCDLDFTRDFDVTQLIPLASKSHPKQQRDGKEKEGTSIDPKSVSVLKLEMDLHHQYLAWRRMAFVNKLCQRIFPIEEVFALGDCDNLEMSMATALKDACETAFIGGRWVNDYHRGENHCTIVNATLPDYSGTMAAHSLFAMAKRHASDNPNKIPVGNPSFGIYAAIGYTVMLVTIVANILDIHLPRKCSFRELRDEMTELDFCCFIWRLHQNILHLAYSQEVDPENLVNNLSLHNLLSLLRCPTLGRIGPFTPDYNLIVPADPCPIEYESEDETETSTTDLELTRDWERVPSGLPTYDSANMGVSSPLDNNTSTAGALFNAAAASLTGWFTSYYKKN